MKKLKQYIQFSQPVLIAIVVAIVAVISLALLWDKDRAKTSSGADAAHADDDKVATANAADDDHDEALTLTPAQMLEQGVKLASVEMGEVALSSSFPARLVVNTDRQAHVSASFSGRVESVNADLGQRVEKGQVLATLWVPDLVDQQSGLKVAQSALSLAKQDYEREKSLWNQGISAKQDYQRAYNAYQQAQIQVQATRSRLSAFGVSTDSNGRYVLKAPISGVVSQKDIVVGENVQLASQLFVIDQLDKLWLEFIVPSNYLAQLSPQQTLSFKSLQTGNDFKAEIQSLSAEADVQTGRLQMRAKVLSQAPELRPNLMVNIQLRQSQSNNVLRVAKAAIQQFEGKDVVFLAEEHGQNMEFSPQPIVLGQYASDGAWVEVKQGLKAGQRYVSQGSFLLKSELEKGEADHGH